MQAQGESGRTIRGAVAALGIGSGRSAAIQKLALQRKTTRELRAAHEMAVGAQAPRPEGEPSDVTKFNALQDELLTARKEDKVAIQGQITALKDVNPALENYSQAQVKAAKAMAAGPGMGSTARNLASIILSVQAYSTAMQGVGFVMAAATPAVGSLIDQMMGWRASATAATTALAAQTTESKGNITAVLAQAAATAGLTKAGMQFVTEAVSQTVMAKAGQAAQAATGGLVRAAGGTPTGIPEGLYGGYGGVGGSALFGSDMGGGKGYMETIAAEFGTLSGGPNPAAQAGEAGSLGVGYATSQREREYIDYRAKKAGMATPGTVGWDVVGGAAAGAMGGAAIGSMIIPGPGTAVGALFGGVAGAIGGGLYGQNAPRTAENVSPPLFDVNAGMNETQIAARTFGLEDLTAASARAGEQVESTGGKANKVTWEMAKSWDEVDAAVTAATKSGDNYSAELALQSGIVMKVTDQLGKTTIGGATKEEHQAAIEQTAKGKTIVSPEAWAQTNLRQMQAEQQARSAQAARTIDTNIPIEAWKSVLQNPLIQPGMAFFPGASQGAPSPAAAGVSGRNQGLVQSGLDAWATSNKALADLAAAGQTKARQDIIDFTPSTVVEPLKQGKLLPQFGAPTVSPGAAAGAAIANATNKIVAAAPDLAIYDSAVASATKLSNEIAGLTTSMMKASQEASTASWANQIRLANRALGDALAMQGKVGGTRLGYLQREQWLNSRASQRLGLQLQQRQITTQLALAQFQAPGETGEERYFKQKEAVATAGIAQQQLNYSFKDFNISGKIWKENVDRAVTDARKSLVVMQLSRDAEGITIVNQGAIAAKSKEMAVHMGKIDAILGKAQGNWSAALAAATSGVGEFAGSLKDGLKEIYKAQGYTVKEKNGQVIVSGTSNAGSTDARGTYGAGQPALVYKPKEGGYATGILGMTTGSHDMTVGEAGTETVAVLRNPRTSSLAPSSSGGGAPVINISISGPVVRSEQDISSLARAVAVEVERSLGRKGQMFGLRGAAV